MTARTIRQIVEDDRTSWQKAEECLMALDEVSTEDLAELAADRRTAAIVFALFTVAERLEEK